MRFTIKSLVALVTITLTAACATTTAVPVTNTPTSTETTQTMPEPAPPATPTADDAQKFVADAEARMAALNIDANRAQWIASNFITVRLERT